MKVSVHRVGLAENEAPITFSAWADKHGLSLEVRERSGDFVGSSRHWYALFTDVETAEGGMLCGRFGNGHTPAEAIREYALDIRGRRLVHKAWRPDERREYVAPTTWLEEDFGALLP